MTFLVTKSDNGKGVIIAEQGYSARWSIEIDASQLDYIIDQLKIINSSFKTEKAFNHPA